MSTKSRAQNTRGLQGRKCQAKTKNGAPCQAWALSGSQFCYMHDPARAAERKAARAAGGRARHSHNLSARQVGEPVRLQSPQDVLAILEVAMGAALDLQCNEQRAAVVAQLASAALQALDLEQRARWSAMMAERAKARESPESTPARIM